MTAPYHKSRSYRKVHRRLPSGTTATRYTRRPAKVGSCPVTGERFQGVPKGANRKAKTARRPQRPFGGVMSSRAMRAYITYLVRGDQQ